MESNNELKIDLYPENKHISELKKESVKMIIHENTLAYSFDINQELGFLCYKVPVLSGFFNAYCNHYPIRIKPDDIWLLILQCFSYHVNENAEKLRSYFVNFDGQKELKIEIDCLEIGKKNLELFIEEINKKMEEFLGNELLENLTPNFTTTDNNSRLICKISIMNTFQKYFRYIFDQCICGIPYIILEGTAEDYKKIILKSKNLRKYDFEWYIDRIIPLVQKMVEAKEGKIDIHFFKNIVQKDEGFKNKSKGCSFPLKYKINYLSGWILKFFGYIKRHECFYRFLEDKIEGDDLNNIPNQILNVPFKIIKLDKTEIKMKFEAGFFGCEQNNKMEIKPVLGWLVSPIDSCKKGRTDNQFEEVRMPLSDIKELKIFKIEDRSKELLNELNKKYS